MMFQYICRFIRNWFFGEVKPAIKSVSPIGQKGNDRLVANYSRRAERCLDQIDLTDVPREIEALQATREIFLNEIEKLTNAQA